MPIRTIGEYLKRWGLTVQRPAKKRNGAEALTGKSMVERAIYPAIHKEAKAQNAEIFGVMKPLYRIRQTMPEGILRKENSIF